MQNDMNENATTKVISHHRNIHVPLVIFGIITGAFSGAIVCLYRFAVEQAGNFAVSAYQYVKGNPVLVACCFVVLALLAFAVSWIVRMEPLIKGSGIPQVEGILLRQIDMKWWRVLIAKFTGGFLCLLAGLALGREGPSIQLGGAVGQGVRRIFKRPETEEKFLITGGASAGLAAAFNAPLAGVVFALEEVHRHFSPAVLLTAMSSAITADLVSKMIFGGEPVMNFKALPVLPLNVYPYLLVLGLLVGIGGVLFNSSINQSLQVYAHIPEKFRLLAPFLCAGIIGFTLPAALGGGNSLIMAIKTGSTGITALLLLLAVRFVFTMTSFGSGAPGGIFLPLLAIGALIGALFGNIMVGMAGIDPAYAVTFIALGMAGFFSSVVRAPVTGIILITEMTGSFSHLLSLSIVVIAAYMTAEMLKSKPVYESLLERLLGGDVKKPKMQDEKAIIETVIHLDSLLDHTQIKDVTWPQGCLVVGIKRGSAEIIPNGDTVLKSGDLLIILADSSRSTDVKIRVLNMASEPK